ncbi:hypothetical protein Q9966_001760 [Columba livia]|nr:hypothetical protein Q9966_001760 [Columba livia]
MTGSMELVISVLDINDNAPQFNQSVYSVHLLEDALEGTVLVRVNATDPDLGTYGEVIYEIDTIVPPSISDIFSIDAKSGDIRLTDALDFETVAFYDLQIKAKDKGTPPLSGHCKVLVEVLDVNDNAPEVWVTSLSVPVPEDASVGTVVALLSVSDRDSGANGRVRCAVWPVAPFGLVSTFAGSYSLVLREALDRERVSEYEVEVRAEDGGSPSLRGRRGVRVPVSDVNDNAPAFAQAVYTVLARENNAAGAELARLWARDPDEADNGRVRYSVWESGVGGGSSAVGGWRRASSYVSVDAESGRLWALQPLDYEEVQVLQFEVRAEDAGEPPLCGNATVQLFVVDENDNAPALLPAGSGGPGPGASGEAAPGPDSGALLAWAAWGAPAGQVVAKIRAVDADSGYNAWLRYELWEPRGKGPFRVGLYSGEVSTTRALEEADGPRQRLVIVVRDHGEPARSATATLSVSLVEGAEASLAAAGSSSSSGAGLRLAEGGAAATGAAATTNVWLVVAICAVSSLFLLAVVLYGASRKSLFLVLAKSLDRETLPVHRLVLTASDGGRPSLTGTVELVISVMDANDNAPQFNQSVYKVQLPENTAEGTLLMRLNATDPDEGLNREFSYSIVSSVPTGNTDLFRIDPKTGEIRLTGLLDFEAVNLLELQIEARDKGTPPLSGHCIMELEVLDVNDNAPEVWVTSLSVPVPEDASVGTVVALLSVSDRDSGANGRVRCAVWPAAPFGLVSTFAGSYSLVLREALDRERVSEYEVEVRAEDGGSPSLRGRRGVRVPVSDVNDNAPAFAQAVYTVLARENNAAGAELARLWARDPDEADNGRVRYSVWEGGVGGVASTGGGWRPASSYVSVDAESGRLWALQPLDYEEVQVLQFEVRAVDAGEPPLCGNATVQLFVVDENDNAPTLLPAGSGGPGPGTTGEAAPGPVSGALWAWAAWGAPAGQVVAKIRAVDADSGYNAWLRYELWEPRGKGPFRVGLYSGEVSTTRALEEADGPRQRLVIVVRDHGEPARSATATLSVSLVEGAEAALAAAGSSSSSGAGLRPAEGGAAAIGAAATTNVWLVVAICAVSSLFLLAVVLYGASRWAPRAGVLSGPGPATLVCASEVGSWSYSQRQSRSLCVADGAGKSDLMVFSPNFPPPPGPAAKETQPEPPTLLDTDGTLGSSIDSVA